METETRTLTPEQREELLLGGWYSHDARWFNAVAEEYGPEVANKLNRRAVTALAKVEAHRLAKMLGREPARDLPDFFAFIDDIRSVYVPSSLSEMEVSQIDDRTYEVEVTKCFVAGNIARAGIADSYECAVFDRLHGWHEAAGLPLASEFGPIQCPMAKGQRCRQLMRIRSQG